MADARDVASTYGTERPSRLEARVAKLAARQHGVVSVAQLRELGLSPSAARGRVSAGRLHHVHRGVYSLGHPLLAERGRWMAAVLACGSRAALSHRSAAALWGIRPTARAGIDVTAPGRAGRRRAGIEVHDAATLGPSDVTRVDAIPCTTVPRTLLDLAAVLDRRALERAYEQAEVLRVLDAPAVEDLLARSPRRRGVTALRAVVQTAAPLALTRNELEKRFLSVCDAAGIPRPQVNAWVPLDGGGVEVDFLWPAHRLIVETDGHRVHGTRQAFERDRRRDRRLLIAGWRVARFTWRQVVSDPDEVAATVRTLLAQLAASESGHA